MTDRLRRISEANLREDEAQLAHLIAALPTMKRPENVLWKLADLQQSIALRKRAIHADRFENMPRNTVGG